MTIQLASGILVGIGFFIAGLFGLVAFSFTKKASYLFPLLPGVGLLYIFMIGPLSQSDSKLDDIIHIDSKEVVEIRLGPSAKTSRESSLFIHDEFIIQDRESIDRICRTLNTSKKGHDSYPKQANRFARMDIYTQSHTISFGMRVLGKRTGLPVYSSGESGWNYGTLACDELGQVLQEEINKVKEHHK